MARSVLLGLLLALSVACTTFEPPEDRPSLASVTAEAIRDPDTWAPAAVAVAIAVSDTDREISDWAREETPIFGSAANAGEASDTLKSFSEALTYATVLATAESRREILPRVIRRTVILSSQQPLIPWIKQESDRERPNGRDLESFPSGHAGQAFAHAALTRQSLEASDLSPRWKRTISISSRLLSMGTGWARVEAGEHYLTDVLTSAALSNILSRIMSHYIDFDQDRLNFYLGNERALSIRLDLFRLWPRR